jgi:hypothetical protein
VVQHRYIRAIVVLAAQAWSGHWRLFGYVRLPGMPYSKATHGTRDFGAASNDR